MTPGASRADPPSSEEPDAAFKEAMRRHAAGVCILTVGEGEDVNGMAATAVTSFSMSPPSLLACVNQEASIAQVLRPGARFGVTVLGRRHEEVVARFSRKPTGRARFDDDQWRFTIGGRPWLADAIANLACEVQVCFGYATHQALIATVTAARLGPQGPSLIYRDGAFL